MMRPMLVGLVLPALLAIAWVAGSSPTCDEYQAADESCIEPCTVGAAVELFDAMDFDVDIDSRRVLLDRDEP